MHGYDYLLVWYFRISVIFTAALLEDFNEIVCITASNKIFTYLENISGKVENISRYNCFILHTFSACDL
jgi:hypothetical protein